jgi:hypothetical protein
MYRKEPDMPTPDNEKITYYGTRADWQAIRTFFGTFSNGVRIIAQLIRQHPEELRKLTDKQG